jgi:hypothetical protein
LLVLQYQKFSLIKISRLSAVACDGDTKQSLNPIVGQKKIEKVPGLEALPNQISSKQKHLLGFSTLQNPTPVCNNYEKYK